MENATKALEIAAGVLLSVLILGMLTYGFSQLSSIKQTEDDNERLEKAGEFNADYETYNRDGVYGSEVLSLANKIENYNNKDPEADGYSKIELSVTLNNVSGNQYFKDTTYNTSFREEKTNKFRFYFTYYYDELQTAIKNANFVVNGKNISYWSGSSSEVKRLFENGESTQISHENKTKSIKEWTDAYKALVNERDDITRKTFNCTNAEYDKNNGRIIKMTFEEPNKK